MTEEKNINFSTLRKQMFEIFMDPHLINKINIIFDFEITSNEMQIIFLHAIPSSQEKTETIIIVFPNEYPEKPPILRFKNNELSPFFLLSELLDEDKWGKGKKEIRMKQYLVDVYTMIQNYYESQAAFNSNQEKINKKQQKTNFFDAQEDNQHNKNNPKSLILSNSENENSQTKNLNRHFKSKLKQILRELVRQYHENQDSKEVQDIFSDNQVGFEQIRKALKNPWFNKQVKWQMKNGKFLNKIMKGMMGIRSKKLMIKYFHIMQAAAQNPESFICWKYQ